MSLADFVKGRGKEEKMHAIDKKTVTRSDGIMHRRKSRFEH